MMLFVFQGTLSNHEITVQSEDGQMVAVNPDTIIVQQGGEEVVVASSSAQGKSYFSLECSGFFHH